MITYRYSALSPNGARVKGVVDALDEYGAVEKIKATCPVVLSIQEVKTSGLDGLLSKEIGHKVDTKALAVMCSQFAIILSSGIPISNCTTMIAEQTKDKKLKRMLTKSAEDISQGVSVSVAFEKNCPDLPVTFTETIRAGELSGTLEDSFKTLQIYYEKSYKVSEKMKAAMSYPIFVVCIAVIVLMIVMIKVIPTITDVFSSLGGELPLMTRILINISNFFGAYWIWMVLITVLLIIGIKYYHHTENGKLHWSKTLLKLPVLGNINTLNGCEQFADTMAALLKAGLGVGDSLKVTAKVLDNYAMSLEVKGMVEKIETGQQLKDVMNQSQYFPDVLREMTGVGETTGELEKTLDTIGAYYTNEHDHAVTQAIARLEPTMLVILALFAGFIVISIYLPMFTMYNLM